MKTTKTLLALLLFSLTLTSLACGDDTTNSGVKPDEENKDDSCNIVNIINKATVTMYGKTRPAMPLFSKFTEQSPMTVSDKQDFKQAVFQSGWGTPTGKSRRAIVNPFRYINFDENAAVKISDQEAFEKSKEWHIGVRQGYLIVNGGKLPGKISVNRVEGDDDFFKNYSLADAKALEADQFLQNQSITNDCKLRELAGHVWTAPAQLLERLTKAEQDLIPYVGGTIFGYNGGDGHRPEALPKQIFIFSKKGEPNWFVKMRVAGISMDADTGALTYVIEYKKL